MSSPEHLRARDAQVAAAEDEYKRWFAAQPPEEKARLRKLKLDKPPSDSTQVSGRTERMDSDVTSTSSTAAFDLASLDTYADQLAEEFGLDDLAATLIARSVSEIVRRERSTRASGEMSAVIGMLLRAENVKTSAAGLAYASGLADLNNFGPLRTYASLHGLSPAAISKQRIKWERVLGIAPSIHAKPKTACAAFSKAQKEKHWRKEKFTVKKPPQNIP